MIIKNLKAKGSCLRSGIFVIPKEIESFLKKKYCITKQWKNSQVILDDLGLIVTIYRPEFSKNSIRVSNFQSKFGNRSTLISC